jgi:hypothetical protein
LEKLIFTNSEGQKIIFSNDPPYLLTSLSGTGAIETTVHTQKAPHQDGSTFIDTNLQERPINFGLEIVASNPQELFSYRINLNKVFNPKLGPGILRYEYYGEAKEVEATVDLAPVFPDGSGNKGLEYQKALISLICPNPFWLDTFDTSEPLIAFIGGFQFPLSLPTQMGVQGDSRLLINQGDVHTPVLIEFQGPASNPVIKNNTTGEFIKVNRDIGPDQKLVINTAFGQKRVEIENSDGTFTNVFNWIDLDSTFFSLIPGDNEIEYQADSGGNYAAVTVTYRNRYVGI